MKSRYEKVIKGILAIVFIALIMIRFDAGALSEAESSDRKATTDPCVLTIELSDMEKVVEHAEYLPFEERLDLPINNSTAIRAELLFAMEDLLPVKFIDEEDYQAVIAVDASKTEWTVFFINKGEEAKDFRFAVMDDDGNPVSLIEGSATAYTASIEELTEEEFQRYLDAGVAVELLGEFVSLHDDTMNADDILSEEEEPGNEVERFGSEAEEPGYEVKEFDFKKEEPGYEFEEFSIQTEEPGYEGEGFVFEAEVADDDLPEKYYYIVPAQLAKTDLPLSFDEPVIPESYKVTVEAVVVKETVIEIGKSVPNSFIVAKYNLEAKTLSGMQRFARAQGLMGPQEIVVTFDPDNGEVEFTATVDENGLCKEPLSPALKMGMSSFIGWYLEGKDDPFDFSAVITESITLKARYSDKYLVMFKDASGFVYYSRQVQKGCMVAPPEQDPEPIGETWFVGWKIDDPAEKDMFHFGTPITKNLTLVPVYGTSYYVYFVSGGSVVDPVLAARGSKIQKPANPTRVGYEFAFWSTSSDATHSETGKQYYFNTNTVEQSFTLYAIWKPKMVNYTIVCWIEKPNIKGSPGTKEENFIYHSSSTETALAGSTVTPSIPSDTIPPHFEYSHSKSTYISGEGNSVASVYLKRIEYTITFDLLDYIVASNESYKEHIAVIVSGGKEYVKKEYKLVVKLDQDISATWPRAVNNGNATYVKLVTNEYDYKYPSGERYISYTEKYRLREFAGFSVPKNGEYDDKQDRVGNGTKVTNALLPNGVREVTLTVATRLTSNNGAVLRKAYYYLEPLPGESKPNTEVFNQKTYYRDDSQTDEFYHAASSTLTPKGITGMTYAGKKDGSDTFYFNRKSYKLTINPGNGKGETVITYLYDQKISAPTIPTRPGYQFAGWYLNAEYPEASKFDFTNATMPAGDLMLFAKWEASDYTATFYNKAGGQVVGTQSFAKDQRVAPINQYVAGQSYAGLGEFIGWYWYVGTSTILSPYPFESLYPNRDITLFGCWKTDGFKITYDTGGGTGSVPVDPAKYKIGVYAPVASGAHLKKGSQVFTGWQVNGTGPNYYSGAIIEIKGDVNLVAVYASSNSLKTVTYNANYTNASPSTKELKVAANTNITLEDESCFTRDGYRLIGWSSNKSGGGASCELSQQYLVTANITLYAVWEEQHFTITGTVFAEDEHSANGIYDAQDAIFPHKGIVLKLYRADSGSGPVSETTPDPVTGVYQFKSMEDGTYYVEISGVPKTHELYGQILNDPGGNKFDIKTGKTLPFQCVKGATYLCNGGVTRRVIGSLTLSKTGSDHTDNGMVNGRLQKFVFRIQYTPIDSDAPTQTFYEVLSLGETRKIINLPCGTYLVTELDDWAADYQQQGLIVYKNSNEISRQTPDISAECINTRIAQTFFHAVAHTLNDFSG